MQQALDYTRNRKVFGKLIATYQNTRFKFAELKGELAIGRAYVDCRAQRIYGGTNEIMRELIARAM